MQAQQQYDQFVGQFKPATTYVDDYEASLAGILTTYKANVAQANALAQAAGASGASVSDLTNILQASVTQEAALMKQLEGSAQDLAFSLGLTTTGSLDEVNQEIARLQGQAGSGASAIGGFGNAMQAAAQQATDAMSLLLGDLSPLNDQAKLQRALQGLQAGTVTQEQVLEIGRRLYATGQQYTDLFNQVSAYTPHAANAVPVTGGSSQSPADQARLAQLLQEQQQLEAAQTTVQYQTLAQQIAEIATGKGESFDQAIKDLGVSESALEKGLGLANDAALETYLAGIQQQTDSDGNNTAILADLLREIRDELKVGGLGPITGGRGGTSTTADASGRAGSPSPGLPSWLGPPRGPRGSRLVHFV